MTRFHVPGSEKPSDEFLAPTGEWYAVLRAVSFDSWLMWKHALPEEPSLRRQLTRPVFDNIVRLGRAIHELHMTMPDYRRLTDTPFHVTRWWDPLGEPPWSEGRRVLLRYKGYTAHEFLRFRSKTSALEALVVSEHWMELELNPRKILVTDAPAKPTSGRQERRCPAP